MSIPSQTVSPSSRDSRHRSPLGAAARSRALGLLQRVDTQMIVLLLVFVLNLVLVSPSLMPEFAWINPHDEAKYIDSGWRLLRGELRDLAWGPLVAFVYAPVHLLLGRSPDWFLAEAWAGRFILFILLQLSTYYLASRFKGTAHPYVVAGVLFVSLPFFTVVSNQSDALFASLSALALAALLSFYHSRRLADISLGALFVGFAMLTRAEAVLLAPLYVLLALAVGRRLHWPFRLAAAAVVPLAAVMALYLTAYRISSGGLDLGMGARAYDSFEWNQSVLTGGDLDLARQEARRLFGTYEDNGGSVIRAILRNPPAFALRILANARNLPDQWLAIFGKKLGPITFILAASGVVALLRRGHARLLAVIFLWSLQPLVALGFLALHIVPQLSHLALALASVGAAHFFRADTARWQRGALFAASAALGAYGWIDAKPAFLAAGLVTAAALGIGTLACPRHMQYAYPNAIRLLLLFAGMLILRGPYPFPNYPSLGASPEEQAVHLLQTELPGGSLMLAPYPGPVIAARMDHYDDLAAVPEDIGAPEALHAWLMERGVRAIYIDRVAQRNEEVLRLLNEGLGKYFRVGYAAEDGRVRVLLVNP